MYKYVKIFGICFMSIIAIILLVIAYLLKSKQKHKKKNCSEKTEGKVIRYSRVAYNDICLPVVQYYVNGKRYKVVGPKFKAIILTSESSLTNKPLAKQECNIEEGQPLPDVLKVNQKKNSMVSISFSPLLEFYPVGKQVDVFYNPKKPKEAYVERYVNTVPSFVSWLIAGIGVLVFGLGVIIFFI